MAALGDKVARKVGEAIVVSFGLRQAGVAQSGLSPTAEVFDEAGVSFATPTVTEVGTTGIYEFSFTPDAAGKWRAVAEETTLPAVNFFAWDVVATVIGDQLPIQLSAAALQQEAQDAIDATRLDELVLATAASPAAGSLVDQVQVELTNARLAIERFRTNSAVGRTIYWDPVNGNNANDGLAPDRALLGFSNAMTLIDDEGHDTLFVVRDPAAGTVTYTSPININKADVTVLFPGRDFLVSPNSSGAPAVSLSAAGVRVFGLRVRTVDVGGTDDAILIASTRCHLGDFWVDESRGRGVVLAGGSTAYSARVERGLVQACLGAGVVVSPSGGSRGGYELRDLEVRDCGGSGILLDGAVNSIDAVTVENVVSRDNGEWGILEQGTVAGTSLVRFYAAGNALGRASLVSGVDFSDGLYTDLVAVLADTAAMQPLVDVAVSSRAAPGDAMDLVAGAVDAAAIATDAIDGDAVAASAVTKIQAGLATAAAVAAVQAAVDALNDLSSADVAAAIAADPGLLKILHRVGNRVDLNPANGVVTVYDDAGVAEFTGLAYRDVAQTLLYDGTGPVHSVTRLVPA